MKYSTIFPRSDFVIEDFYIARIQWLFKHIFEET